MSLIRSNITGRLEPSQTACNLLSPPCYVNLPRRIPLPLNLQLSLCTFKWVASITRTFVPSLASFCKILANIPPLPHRTKRLWSVLWGPISFRRIPPFKFIAGYVHYSADHPSIVYPWVPSRFREIFPYLLEGFSIYQFFFLAFDFSSLSSC